MTYNQKNLLIIVLSLMYLLGTSSSAAAQLPDTDSITSLHSLNGEIAAYDSNRKALRFMVPSGRSLVAKRTISVDGNVMGVAAIAEGYLIATGMSREDLSAPIRLSRVSSDGKHDSLVFEYSGERNQVNRIVSRGNKIWVDFFESKYFTKVGYLSPTAQAPWLLTDVASVRMGDSFEVVGDSVFVGRSYGEPQGQDGDLLLLSNGKRTTLPSYRGVRAIAAIGDPAAPELVVADGWHQNYGQLAQGRISRVRRQPDTGRYSLELVTIDPDNYGFSKLLALPAPYSSKIVALGSSSVIVFDVGVSGDRRVIHKIQQPDRVPDLAVTTGSEGLPLIVVLDGGLHVYPLQ